MHLRKVTAILPFALLAACGGSGSNGEDASAVTDTAAPTAETATDTATESTAPPAPVVEEPAAATSAAPASEAAATAAPGPTAASPAPTASAVAKPAAVTAPASFAICRTCHSVEPGKNGVGPTMFGIVGSKAGEVPGYAFSPALKNSGIKWDRAALDTWLKGPMKMVPGTKMVIAVPDAAKRKEIIDYLETLK